MLLEAGLKPWQMDDLTPTELSGLIREHRRMTERDRGRS